MAGWAPNTYWLEHSIWYIPCLQYTPALATLCMIPSNLHISYGNHTSNFCIIVQTEYCVSHSVCLYHTSGVVLLFSWQCLLAKKFKPKLLPLKCITVKIQYYFYSTVHCANTDTVLSTLLIQQSISWTVSMQLPKVAVSALLLQDRASNENGPDSGFYYWLCKVKKKLKKVRCVIVCVLWPPLAFFGFSL